MSIPYSDSPPPESKTKSSQHDGENANADGEAGGARKLQKPWPNRRETILMPSDLEGRGEHESIEEFARRVKARREAGDWSTGTRSREDKEKVEDKDNVDNEDGGTGDGEAEYERELERVAGVGRTGQQIEFALDEEQDDPNNLFALDEEQDDRLFEWLDADAIKDIDEHVI